MAPPVFSPQPALGSLRGTQTPATAVALASAARTVTNSVVFDPGDDRGIVEVVLVITAGSTLSITPSIERYDPASDSWITLLTGTASTGAATQRLSVGPHAAVTANVSAQCALGPQLRVTITHGNATAATYSVGLVAS